MDFAALFSMQEKLDEHIIQKHKLQGKDLLEDKYLALLVELGELANETRCFKFWSQKSASKREKILEEYVDGIHFILSLGIEKGYRFTGTTDGLSKQKAKSLTEQFNHCFEAVVHFRQDPSEQYYRRLFLTFLQLGKMLQFNTSDIFQAYLDKNEVNFTRQAKGY